MVIEDMLSDNNEMSIATLVPLVIQNVASDRTNIPNDHRDIAPRHRGCFFCVGRADACPLSHRPRANRPALVLLKRGNDRAIEYHDDFVLVFTRYD